MAGAGKKLQGGGAPSKLRSPAAQVSDGGYGRPPHPLRLVPGQLFFPRHGRGRRRLVEVTRMVGGEVRARRLDAPRSWFSVSATRLLACDQDGQGRFYSFNGWQPHTYRSWAQVACLEDDERAVLVVPEWHPGRPVPVPSYTLPLHAREPGCWLEVCCDLSASSPARLRVAPGQPCPAPDPGLCHRPVWRAELHRPRHERPDLGEGCGDLVLEAQTPSSPTEAGVVRVFVRDRPDGVVPDGRVYIPHPDEPRVLGWTELVGIEPSPNGATLICRAGWKPLPCRIPFPGPREQGRWRWRWWPRALEQPLSTVGVERYPYDPHLHRGGYVHQRAGAR